MTNNEHFISGNGTLFASPPKVVASTHSKVTFGKYCAIAPNLKIITLNHDYNYPAIQGTFFKKYFNAGHPTIYIIPTT